MKTLFIAGTDPCTNYQNLSDIHSVDDYKRSAGYVMESSSQSFCDNLLTAGWYRATSPAGGTMVNACPAMGRCNTEGPNLDRYA